MTAPQAFRALYGSPAEAKAARTRTAKAAIGDSERDQEICTPQIVLDCIDRIWPGGAILDPCGSRRSLRTAEHVYHYPEQDGLTLPWARTNYVNPPYADLRAWLEKATFEWLHGRNSIMLCPHRTHRKWFRKLTRPHAKVELDPLTFEGFKQSFPQALVLIGFGVPRNEMEYAFHTLGEVTCHS